MRKTKLEKVKISKKPTPRELKAIASRISKWADLTDTDKKDDGVWADA